MKITTLDQLYLDELRDLHSAETQIAAAMPRVIEVVDSPEFRGSLQAHLSETQRQIERLESIFRGIKEAPSGNTCEATKGLLAECDELLSETQSGSVRDCACAGALERIEHYETAAYNSAARLAQCLGRLDDLDLLKQTLDEEIKAGQTVAAYAESSLFGAKKQAPNNVHAGMAR
jgi:ferritin-like metal-binding protein YciE